MYNYIILFNFSFKLEIKLDIFVSANLKNEHVPTEWKKKNPVLFFKCSIKTHRIIHVNYILITLKVGN